MVKKLAGLFGLLGFAVFCVFPAQAQEQGQLGVYVAAKAGVSITKIDSPELKTSYGNAAGDDYDDTVFTGGVAVGYDFSKQFGLPLRTEFEYNGAAAAEDEWTDEGFKTGLKVQTNTFLWNVYFDIPTGIALKPFIGAGIGLAVVDMEGSLSYPGLGSYNNSENSTNFAWNLTAGLGYEINESWAIELSYRYLDVGTADTGTADFMGMSVKGEADVAMHQIMFGVRFTF